MLLLRVTFPISVSYDLTCRFELMEKLCVELEV